MPDLKDPSVISLAGSEQNEVLFPVNENVPETSVADNAVIVKVPVVPEQAPVLQSAVAAVASPYSNLKTYSSDEGAG